jgi:hypothetical protein
MLGEIFSDEIVVLQEEIRIKEAQVSSLQFAELSVIDAMAALSSAIATATEITPLASEKLKKSVMSLWDNDPNDRAPDDGNQDSDSHPENNGNGNQDSDSHPENNGNGNRDSDSHPENSGNTENNFLGDLTYYGDNLIGHIYSSNGELQSSYQGGNNKAKLESWGRYLVRENYAAGFQLRAPKRVTAGKHEIKILGLTNLQILYLINPKKQPPSPDFAEINPSTFTVPKMYEFRRNIKTVFKSPDYQEALDFYVSAQ